MTTYNNLVPHIRITCEGIEDVLHSLGIEASNLTETIEGHGPEEWGIEDPALLILDALVSHVQPSIVVELGTYKGRTASVLGQRLESIGHGSLITIDDFRSVDKHSYAERMSKYQLDQVVVQIATSSVEAFANWSREKIDILIIDAAHDYASSCIDFALWSRLVQPNGWIVIHDTQTRLRRRFPDDYIHPLRFYDVLEVMDLKDRSQSNRWEGIAFVRHRKREWSETLPPQMEFIRGATKWAGADAD